jgi:SAM-dependent methyltransferase
MSEIVSKGYDTRIQRGFPADYHEKRRKWWDSNALVWARYVDADEARVQLFNRVAASVRAAIPNGDGQKRIADFGCGEGLFLRCCTRYIPEISLVGVDYSDSMLALAAKRSQLAPIEHMKADIELDGHRFASEFHVATAILVLDEVERLDIAMAAISASLVPGGTAIIVVLDPTTELLRYSDAVKTSQGVCDGCLVILKRFRIAGLYSPAPYCRVVRPFARYIQGARSAGLTVIGVETLAPSATRASDVTLAPEYVILTMRKEL